MMQNLLITPQGVDIRRHTPRPGRWHGCKYTLIMIDFTTTLKQEVEQRIHQIESGEKNVLLRATAASDMLEGIFGQLR